MVVHRRIVKLSNGAGVRVVRQVKLRGRRFPRFRKNSRPSEQFVRVFIRRNSIRIGLRFRANQSQVSRMSNYKTIIGWST